MSSAVSEVTTSAAAPLRPVRLGKLDVVLEKRANGVIHIRAAQPLGKYHRKLSDALEHWARTAPERVFLAQRDSQGDWRKLSYAQVLSDVRRIGAALLRRGLSPDKPIVVLSGNDIEHALLGLAATYVGIPYAPISPAYSLMSSDFGKLRMIIELLTPGLIFVNDGGPFARALYATVPDEIELIVARNPLGDRKTTLFSDLLGAQDDAGVAAAHEAVTPDTIVKFLFTSGSTGSPKAVINTHRMLCSNQAMLASGFAFVTDEPPVVVDWLPWSHTFGSNHNFNMVLTCGGSLYIDEGNPTPPGVPKTVRNLREIAPTIYFNVPKGYEALIAHFRADETLRRNFFSRLKVLFYAGAGLNQTTWDELTQLAVETTGERIIFLSSLGSTETSPLALACSWDFDRPGNIGVPTPGVELKLVPNEGKLEARLRGPHITPGYWRQHDLTRDAFDDEGFYKIGDALKFVDPSDPGKRTAVRRPDRRGFQTFHGHLGQRRTAARALHRSFCAVRPRRGLCRRRPRFHRCACVPRRRGLPETWRPGPRRVRSRHRRRAGRPPEIRRAAEKAGRSQPGILDAHRTRDPDGRSAIHG